MQHVEEAGIHSGDSACVLPPHTLGGEMLDRIREQTTGIARALGVVGLLNVQFAIRGDDRLYVIEANPRASRTVPFVSKAIGLPLAKLACRILLGERIADLELPADAAVRPRVRQGGGAAVQPLRRRRLAAGPGDALHRRGDGDRRRLPDRVRQGPGGGGRQAAQPGHGVPHRRRRRQAGRHRDRQPRCTTSASRSSPPAAPPRRCGAWASRRPQINKLSEGSRHVVDWIERGEVDLVINTPVGHRRPLRRLRDPLGGGRARDPVHHHHGRAAWRRRGRSSPPGAASPRSSRCRRCTAAARARRPGGPAQTPSPR